MFGILFYFLVSLKGIWDNHFTNINFFNKIFFLLFFTLNYGVWTINLRLLLYPRRFFEIEKNNGKFWVDKCTVVFNIWVHRQTDK